MENLPIARINLARLTAGLYRDGEPPSPGLEIGDPRLDAINDAAFKGDYAQACALAQAVWDEGVRDVRLVGYLLYGYYLEADARALAPVFEQLTLTLSTQWDRIGPARKDKPADGALHWLFSSLIRQLDGHEKARDEQYNSWLRPDGAAAFAAAEAAAEALVAEVGKRFADGKCFDKLRNLSGRIREISSVLRAAAESHAAQEATAAAEATRHEPGNGKVESAPARSSEDRRGNAFTVEGGAALGLLLRKLRLFEQLVVPDSSEEQTLKAAVIARDIEQLLGAFDPALYFPKLFVPYFRAMTRCADQLAQVMAELEAPRHKSLVQIYHADFDAFAES